MEWGNSANINEEHLARLEEIDANLLQRAQSLAGQTDAPGQQEVKQAGDLVSSLSKGPAGGHEERVTNCRVQRPIWSLRAQVNRSQAAAVKAAQSIQALHERFASIERTVLDKDPQETALSRDRLSALLPGMEALLEDSKGSANGDAARADLVQSISEAKELLAREQTQVPRHDIESARQGLYQAADRVVQAQNRTSGIDCRQQDCLALTFDDGPSPISSQVFKALQDNHAVASFFSIGQKIDAQGGNTLAKIAQAGFPVGSHTWSHTDFALISAQHLQGREFSDAAAAVKASTGRPVTLVRPPHGSVNEQSRTDLLNGLAAGIALYNVDSYDWAPQASASSVEKKVLSQVRPGSIILMHDAYQHTADALPHIIDQLRARGDQVRFVTITQLTGEYPRAGDVYYSRTNILRM
ncbi:hypothetical protein KIM372_08960 [Bombiscardovia nodaiensis]|uniref:NodB homology domain-containing protein n=1 Tax=Bombiscardovia nodaiensis TaxID=2932181 RepID=A0ABM8B8T3_9BIFI|nr:hypothetical protein KIM372_08960 [Bombiscardovia nodaiensis]